jgi:putative inorganic carbon (HCO3(-)) transporter
LTAYTTRLPRPAASASLLAVSAVLVAGAAAVGALGTFKPVYAAALVAAALLGLIVAADIRVLPVFLVFTMFVESVSLGPGLRVGRIIGLLALLAVLSYLLLRGRVGLRPNALFAAVAAYGIWMLASVLWASSPGYSAHTLSSYLLAVSYMLAFAVLVRARAQVTSAFATLAVGSLIFGLVAFAEYARHAGDPGGYRAVGLQGDPNYFAVYEVIALPAVLVLAAQDRKRWRELAYYAVLGAIALSVVASLSRTGLLTFALVVLATLFSPWRFFFRSPSQKATYAVALILVSGAAFAIGSHTFVARAKTILNASPEGDRGSGRTDLWKAAFTAIHEKPWLGLGAGGFEANSLQLLQITPGVDTRRSYVRADRPVHNAYLEQLTDMGPVGLFLFVSVLLLALRTLIRALRRARRARAPALEQFSAALIASFVAFCFSGIFLSNQLLKPLWIMIGLALALEVMTGRLRPAVAYPAGVTEPVVDQTAVREAELRAESERLERRRRAVLELGEEVRRRLARVAERERQLEGQPADTTELEARVRGLDERERRLKEREARLLERIAELGQREVEQLAQAPPPPPEPEPELELAAQPPVRDSEPVVPPGRAVEPLQVLPPVPAGPGIWTLPDLERAVAALREQDPERAEELGYYVVYLREYARADGSLPASFDAMIDDVLGDLIAAR